MKEIPKKKAIILKGIPASPGIITGKVKIINTPEEIQKMEEAWILVAPVTNPQYTIAMMKAGAIVTDVGGILSHAAIVAREIGIPCVVGTKDATKKLEDGMEVVVNGTKGFVFKKNR